MNDINIEAVRKALNSLNHDIEISTNQLAKGASIELEGLDIRVGALCAAIAKLPEEEGRALETRLKTLIFGLDNLAETLKSQQENQDIENTEEGE